MGDGDVGPAGEMPAWCLRRSYAGAEELSAAITGQSITIDGGALRSIAY